VGKKTVKPDEELAGLRELVDGVDADEGGPKKRTDRRGMLKLAGAALLGAAGAAAVRAVPASAASGDYMITGCINVETTPTQVSGSATNGQSALQAQGGIGLHGQGNASTNALAVGVLGTTKNGGGTAVQAQETSGVGVQGTATSGSAGWFQATTGWDVQLGQAISGTIADPNFHGTGRLSMVGRTDVGGVGPNIAVQFLTHSTLFAGGHFQHELVRGNDASIWASRYDLTGATTQNQFRWKRINTLRVDTADGMGTSLKPLRLYDSRTGSPLGPFGPGTVNTHTVAGAGAGAQHIPADAIAVTGNLTAVSFSQNGFLTIFPAGATYDPNHDPSTMNFSVGQYAIANSFVCGLTNGQLKVYVGIFGTTKSNYILDITGYLE
jgi:hypothetical protein